MTEHLISYENAHADLLTCAAYLAEEIADKNAQTEVFEKIVPLYLERGEVDLAAELANTIDFAPKRESLLSDVAVKCAKVDDDEYAFQLIETIDDPVVRESALENIALEQTAAGKFDKALTLARKLEHNSMALSLIASELNVRGDQNAALEVVAEIGDSSEKALCLQIIAVQRHKSGDTAQAVELLEKAYSKAREIDFAPEKIKSLHSVSYSFGEVGRRDRSIEILSEIQRIAETFGAVDRDNRLAEVSLALFEAGSIDLADRALDAVTDKTQIASVLIGYAREYWERGEHSEAKDALHEAHQVLRSQADRETRDSLARFKTFTVITAQFAEFGETENAVSAAESINFEGERNASFAQIARILAQQGKEDEAHRTLKLIENAEIRCSALLGIADAFYRAENLPKAVEYVDEAAELTEDADNNLSRLSLSIAAANRYAVFGALEKAHRAAAEILGEIAKLRSPVGQSNALADLAQGFRQANLELDETEKKLLRTILD